MNSTTLLLDVWMAISDEDWQRLLDGGKLKSSTNQYEGYWQDTWLREQLRKRTEKYGGDAPHYAWFDPVFGSPTCWKILKDSRDSYKQPPVVVRLNIPKARTLLFPEELWLNVFNRMYQGVDKADSERFDELVYGKGFAYLSDQLPDEYIVKIERSWDAALDRLAVKRACRHRKRGLTEAVFEEVRIEDVESAIRLNPDFLIRPVYASTK